MRRYQLNLTITEPQQEFIKKNYGKMNIYSMADQLNLTYNKLHNNLKLMGLFKPKKPNRPAKVIEGMFDVSEFGKYYNW